MENITKEQFVENVLKAHKTVITDAWHKWQVMVEEDTARLKDGEESQLEGKYPDGFKDYLLEFIDGLIADNDEQKLSTS